MDKEWDVRWKDISFNGDKSSFLLDVILRYNWRRTALSPVGRGIIGIEAVPDHNEDHDEYIDDEGDVPQHVLPEVRVDVA